MRLIDANVLKQQDFQDFSCTDVMAAIDDCPTIEAEPVRYGHWIEEDDIQICSECGEEHSFGVYRPSYCDTCGAKMDVPGICVGDMGEEVQR